MKPRFRHAARTTTVLALAVSAVSAQSASSGLAAQTACEPGTVYEEGPNAAAVAIYKPQEDGRHCIEGTDCTIEPNTESRQQPTQSDQCKRREGGSGGGAATAVAIAGGLGILAVMLGQMNKWATPEELDAKGPRFPNRQEFGRFQVQGYAAAGWPFLVDLETEPGTWTWVELKYKDGRKSEPIFISGDGNGGRRTELVHLPGNPGQLGIARYSIHSALLRHNKRAVPMRLRIYAVGAGPNAVGAVDLTASRLGPIQQGLWTATSWRGISTPQAHPEFIAASFAQGFGSKVGSYLTVTNFGPRYASSPADVRWSVAAHRTFQVSQVEVLQVPQGKGDYVIVSLAQGPRFPQQPVGGTWAQLPMPRKKIGRGTYTLQARAWMTYRGGGDWTGAYAPEYVDLR